MDHDIAEAKRLMDEIIAKYGSFDNAVRAGMRAWWETPEGKKRASEIERAFFEDLIQPTVGEQK